MPKRSPNIRRKTSPIIPNPHRDELVNYKNRLEEQLTILVTRLISQIPSVTELPINLEQLNIKQQVSMLVTNLSLDNNDDTDDETY